MSITASDALPYDLPAQMPWLFVPTVLTTGSAAQFAGHKTQDSGFLSCVGPSAGGSTIPLATVLGQFGPKSNYEWLYYLATFNIYIYSLDNEKKNQPATCTMDRRDTGDPYNRQHHKFSN